MANEKVPFTKVSYGPRLQGKPSSPSFCTSTKLKYTLMDLPTVTLAPPEALLPSHYPIKPKPGPIATTVVLAAALLCAVIVLYNRKNKPIFLDDKAAMAQDIVLANLEQPKANPHAEARDHTAVDEARDQVDSNRASASSSIHSTTAVQDVQASKVEEWDAELGIHDHSLRVPQLPTPADSRENVSLVPTEETDTGLLGYGVMGSSSVNQHLELGHAYDGSCVYSEFKAVHIPEDKY